LFVENQKTSIISIHTSPTILSMSNRFWDIQTILLESRDLMSILDSTRTTLLIDIVPKSELGAIVGYRTYQRANRASKKHNKENNKSHSSDISFSQTKLHTLNFDKRFDDGDIDLIKDITKAGYWPHVRRCIPRFSELSDKDCMSALGHELMIKKSKNNKYYTLQLAHELDEYNSIMLLEGKEEVKELPPDYMRTIREYEQGLNIMEADFELKGQDGIILTVNLGDEVKVVRAKKPNSLKMIEKMRRMAEEERILGESIKKQDAMNFDLVSRLKKKVLKGDNMKMMTRNMRISESRGNHNLTIRSDPGVSNTKINVFHIMDCVSNLIHICSLLDQTSTSQINIGLISKVLIKSVDNLNTWLEENFNTTILIDTDQ